jgi:hypothetical protein
MLKPERKRVPAWTSDAVSTPVRRICLKANRLFDLHGTMARKSLFAENLGIRLEPERIFRARSDSHADTGAGDFVGVEVAILDRWPLPSVGPWPARTIGGYANSRFEKQPVASYDQ